MTTNFKELGNEYFKSGEYKKALDMYSEGLKSIDLGKEDKLNFYKNKSMCYLKLSKFNDVIETCNAALLLSDMDIKSLYRRSVANMQLSNLSDAHADAKKLIILDCKNKLYQDHIRDLESKIKLQVEDSNSFVGKVNTMFNLLKKADSTEETKLKALNNLAVLVRENSNNHIWNHPDRPLLMNFCQITNSNSIIEAAQRCLSLLFLPSIERTLDVFKQHGAQYFSNMIYSSNSEQSRLTGHYLENVLSGLTQIKAYREKCTKYEAEMKEKSNTLNHRPYPKYQLDPHVEKYVNECLQTLLVACNSRRLSAAGRDSILEILVRFVPSKEGINWSRSLLHCDGGFTRLLEVGAAAHAVERAGQTAPANEISLIGTTHKTKMTVAILLAQIYEDLVSDKDRDLFRDKCCDFVLDLLTDEMIESKVEAANLIGLLFQGPYEAGSAVLGKSGILEGLLLLTRSDVAAHQRVALDAVVLACTKKDKCLAIVADAAPLLEHIYRTGSDAMKVRALVGLCKLGSAGGRDSSIACLAAGSNLELARSCRKFLRDGCQGDGGDLSVLRWASEGLAYLTLDADVKEALVEDEAAVKNLLAVTKNSGLECLYPVCTVLVNVTNSYDKAEILPEMLELAKYAQQHIPETHEKDSDGCARARLAALVRLGLPAALHGLTELARTSPGSQAASAELLARLFLAVAAQPEHRGALIQAGAGRALLGLATTTTGTGTGNTPAGQVLAAQALAKLAITMDPRIAFPGQRSLEVVRPLLQLLHIDNSGLQNYESLLALTNLASLDDSHRRRIVKEKGVSQIEYYMFEEHEMLRRAATECMCNLVSLEEVREKFLGEENDRVKLLVLLCEDAEDVALIKAASGALASLSTDPRCLDKITKVNNWFDIMQAMLACPVPEIQHRAAFTLDSLISNATVEFCQFIASSNMLELLMALAKLNNEPNLTQVASCASHALQVLVGHGLIKPT